MDRSLSRVAELARLQNDHNRGFSVISEHILGREEESNNLLEEKFSGLGFEQLGVGMCSDGIEWRFRIAVGNKCS